MMVTNLERSNQFVKPPVSAIAKVVRCAYIGGGMGRKVIFADRLSACLEGERKIMSAAELARKLGVTDTAVSHWRAAERTPDLDTLDAIAEVLRVPVAYLLGLEPTPHEPQVWGKEHVVRFLAVCQTHRVGGLFYLALATGMRLGELLALKWDSVDLETGELRVSLSATAVRGEMIVGQPKTARAKRTVKLPPSAVAVLRARHEAWSSERKAAAEAGIWSDDGWVWSTTTGQMLGQRNVQRLFAKLCAKVDGLPKLTIHGLRHTWASLAIADGVPLPALSARLGHYSAAFTLATYTHLLPGQDREAAVPLEDLVSERAAVKAAVKRDSGVEKPELSN